MPTVLEYTAKTVTSVLMAKYFWATWGVCVLAKCHLQVVVCCCQNTGWNLKTESDCHVLIKGLGAICRESLHVANLIPYLT